MDEPTQTPGEESATLAPTLADVAAALPDEPEAVQAEPAYEPPPVARPVELPDLGRDPSVSKPRSIDLLLDVDLPVSVELGHTQMAIKNILELGVGSIVKLEKAAGDPVDVVVNGRLVARGEVVVVDESFGVRILGLVSPDQRLGLAA